LADADAATASKAGAAEVVGLIVASEALLVLLLELRVVDDDDVEAKPRARGMYRLSTMRFSTNRTAVQDMGTCWYDQEEEEGT